MRYSNNYKLNLIFISIGAVICLTSLLYSNYIAKELAIKERREMNLWSHAMNMQDLNDPRTRTIINITNHTTSIPAIVIDEFMTVKEFKNVKFKTIDTPKKLRRKLEKMAGEGRTPIPVQLTNGQTITIFYDESALLKGLYWYPYLQLTIIGTLIAFTLITYVSLKSNEQNKIWIGMSKETAHQLGTPTSSLLGWIEYLKTKPIPPDVVMEMGRDVSRLLTVVDRFSKIGSTASISPANIYNLTYSIVSYFSTRIPKGVELSLNSLTNDPLQAMVNSSLFEWVLENLLKNALDTLAGKGSIDVNIISKSKNIIIDVTDSGKGISKSSWNKIFDPGYTTKTRGWGLGLSLSKRIIKQYHNGKIYVASSEIDKGTTIRIVLKKL